MKFVPPVKAALGRAAAAAAATCVFFYATGCHLVSFLLASQERFALFRTLPLLCEDCLTRLRRLESFAVFQFPVRETKRRFQREEARVELLELFGKLSTRQNCAAHANSPWKQGTKQRQSFDRFETAA